MAVSHFVGCKRCCQAILIAVCCCRLALADSASPEVSCSRLLQVGQRLSPRALAEARKLHEQMQQMPGYDYRTRYAFALVLTRQRRLEEALTEIDRVSAEAPDWLPSLRTRVWLEMSTRKYAAAVASMRDVAVIVERLAQPNATGGTHQKPDTVRADDAELRKTAAFLGRTFCFLEAQRLAIMPEEALRKQKQAVLQLLGSYRSDFAHGEETACMRLAENQKDLLAAEAEAARIQAEQRQSLKDAEESLDVAQAAVEYKTEKLKTDLKDKLQELEEEAKGVRNELIRLQFRIDALAQAIQNQKRQVVAQIAQMRWRRTDPDEIPRMQVRLNLIESNVVDLAAQREFLIDQFSAQMTRLSNFESRREDLLGSSEQSAADLTLRRQILKREERKAKQERQAAAKSPTTSDAHSRALNERQHLFMHFEPSPFELEKERLLDLSNQ